MKHSATQQFTHRQFGLLIRVVAASLLLTLEVTGSQAQAQSNEIRLDELVLKDLVITTEDSKARVKKATLSLSGGTVNLQEPVATSFALPSLNGTLEVQNDAVGLELTGPDWLSITVDTGVNDNSNNWGVNAKAAAEVEVPVKVINAFVRDTGLVLGDKLVLENLAIKAGSSTAKGMEATINLSSAKVNLQEPVATSFALPALNGTIKIQDDTAELELDSPNQLLNSPNQLSINFATSINGDSDNWTVNADITEVKVPAQIINEFTQEMDLVLSDRLVLENLVINAASSTATISLSSAKVTLQEPVATSFELPALNGTINVQGDTAELKLTGPARLSIDVATGINGNSDSWTVNASTNEAKLPAKVINAFIRNRGLVLADALLLENLAITAESSMTKGMEATISLDSAKVNLRKPVATSFELPALNGAIKVQGNTTSCAVNVETDLMEVPVEVINYFLSGEGLSFAQDLQITNFKATIKKYWPGELAGEFASTSTIRYQVPHLGNVSLGTLKLPGLTGNIALQNNDILLRFTIANEPMLELSFARYQRGYISIKAQFFVDFIKKVDESGLTFTGRQAMKVARQLAEWGTLDYLIDKLGLRDDLTLRWYQPTMGQSLC